MLKKINYVLNRKQKIQLVLLLAVIFVGAFVELLGVSAVLPVINVALAPETIDETWYLAEIKRIMGFTQPSQILKFLAAVLILIYILKNIYVMMMYSFQYRFIYNNQRYLSVKMMKCYMKQNYLFHISKNVAEFQRNITNDVNGFFTVALNVLQFLAEMSVCVVIVIFLLIQDWAATIAAASFLFVFLLIFTRFFRVVLVRKGEESRQVNVQVTKWLFQAFSGIKEIKVTNKEPFFIERYDRQYKKCAEVQRQQSILTALPRPIMETVCISSLMLVLIVKLQMDNADMTSFISTISVFAVAAFRMLPSFNRITGYLGGMMFNKPAIDAVYKDLVEIEGLNKIADYSKSEEETLELENEIRLDNVSFKYPETDRWILKNASLEIKKNSSVAFIGASGAGKTTLADLILGLLEQQEGTITVDGSDIREHMHSWHEIIGYIPQTIYLMDDTIRANIMFGIDEEQIDENIIQRVLKEAQLDEFVASLKDGLDTIVGDRGVKLSGGQRQRIGIARALYRNPKVLVLDEATSALDNDTEKEVMAAIEGLHGTRTLIIIAHRLSTIKNCDVVYEVGDGKAVMREKLKNDNINM